VWFVCFSVFSADRPQQEQQQQQQEEENTIAGDEGGAIGGKHKEVVLERKRRDAEEASGGIPDAMTHLSSSSFFFFFMCFSFVSPVVGSSVGATVRGEEEEKKVVVGLFSWSSCGLSFSATEESSRRRGGTSVHHHAHRAASDDGRPRGGGGAPRPRRFKPMSVVVGVVAHAFCVVSRERRTPSRTATSTNTLGYSRTHTWSSTRKCIVCRCFQHGRHDDEMVMGDKKDDDENKFPESKYRHRSNPEGDPA